MKRNHIFALLAFVGGLFAAFTSHSERNNLYPTWKFEKSREEGVKVHFISPGHLAGMLYKKEAVTILDIRSAAEFKSYHIPGAQLVGADRKIELSEEAGNVILYGREAEGDIYSLSGELPGKVYVLKGGLEAWNSLVLFPDMLEYRVRNSDHLMRILQRSAFFGGQAKNTQVLNLNLRESRYREGC